MPSVGRKLSSPQVVDIVVHRDTAVRSLSATVVHIDDIQSKPPVVEAFSFFVP
jgi:hypothetical protein